jgi:hypothetical protein
MDLGGEIYGGVCRLLFEDFPPIGAFPDNFNGMTEVEQKEYIIGAFTLKTSFKGVRLGEAIHTALRKYNDLLQKFKQTPDRQKQGFLRGIINRSKSMIIRLSKKVKEGEEEGEGEEGVRGGGKSKLTREKRKKPNTKKKKTKRNKTRRNKTRRNKTRRNKTRRNAKTGGSGSGITAAAVLATVNWQIVAVGGIFLLLLCVLIKKCSNDDADMQGLHVPGGDTERNAMVAPGEAPAPAPAPAPARDRVVKFSAAHQVI